MHACVMYMNVFAKRPTILDFPENMSLWARGNAIMVSHEW